MENNQEDNKNELRKEDEALEKEVFQQQIQQIHSAQLHSGPLPSPEVLAKYDQVLKNGAERIFEMAQNEQSMRRENIANDTLYIKNTGIENIVDIKGGIWIATLGIVAGVLVTFFTPHQVSGVVITIGTPAVLGALTYRKNKS